MRKIISFEDHLHIFSNIMLNIIGEDDHRSWFAPKSGICWNWERYLASETDIHEPLPRLEMTEKLKHLLGGYTPFNEDIFAYYHEANNDLLYKNKARLDFLRKYAK